MFDAIKEHADDNIQVLEIDAHINDDAFAERAVDVLLKLIKE